MDFKNHIEKHFQDHLDLTKRVKEKLADDLARAAQLISEAMTAGHKLLIFGNGGSAADAQHIAAEMTGRYLKDRQPLPAIALTTDTSALTAIANDYGFEHIFTRQVKALAREGDILLAISTSGNSPNVVKAMETGRELGCHIIALTGHDGGQMASQADLALIVPASQTPLIQEMHITIGHILCDLVERKFC
jgi:D-sedoheptulose 7-phosphate isomerase